MFLRPLFHAVLCCCLLSSGQALAALEVATSIAPIRYLVQRIGGAQVSVINVLPPNTNPVHYELKPSEVGQVVTSAAYFSVGLPFEQAWFKRQAEAEQPLQWVDLRQRVQLRDHQVHADHDHGHEHSRQDPHIWLSVRNMQRIAEHIAETLQALQPDSSQAFQSRLADLQAEMRALDTHLSQRFEQHQGGRHFFVFHPAWGYFAEDYALEQVALETQGVTPGPKHLMRVIQQAKGLNSPVVFTQKGFSERSAQILADSIGAQLVALDPMAEDWLSNMRQVGGAIADALR